MTGTKYLSELVDLNELKIDRLNVIKAPTGSGKTYFALTAIPETLGEKACWQIVYLIDTINGKEQILNNYNVHNYSKLWDEIATGEVLYWGDGDESVVIMTYAKFGLLLESRPDFHKSFKYIICDELPSLFKFQTYSARPNLHSIAREGLERAVKNDQTKVIALSATPNTIKQEFHAPIFEVPIDQTQVRRYETKEIVNYTNLEYLLSTLDPAETGLCYLTRINQMKKLEGMARDIGLKPVSVWSIRNTDHHMTQEQLKARETILKEFRIPPEYNFLIINASSETSLKIKSPVDYVIVQNDNYDTQVQVRGRVNSDLSKLYLPLLGTTDLTVPEEYLNIPLFTEEKTALCTYLNRTNPYNRRFGWPTIKSMLIDCDYTITEGRKNNRRYAIISPPQ